MDDDCWSDDGRQVESSYRTISSLRELVGPGTDLFRRRGSSDDDNPPTLKGTRFRRVRCSEDPGYFVSTPLERFKLTKLSKLEARKRVRRIEDGFSNDSDFSDSAADRTESDAGDSFGKSDADSVSENGSTRKEDDSAEREVRQRRSGTAAVAARGKIEYPSADRFQVMKIGESLAKGTLSNGTVKTGDRFIVSGTEAALPSESPDFKSLPAAADEYHYFDPNNLSSFLKDYTDLTGAYGDLSPSFRDLSCCQPRRRLSQCPEEDETEEEPAKRPVLPRLHMDKVFFDSSLVEMKSQASSSSTIDTIGSAEEVWVKRIERRPKQVRNPIKNALTITRYLRYILLLTTPYFFIVLKCHDYPINFTFIYTGSGKMV